MQDVEQFVTAARAFLAFTHEANALEARARFRKARSRLIALYAAATELPNAWEVGADHEVAERTPRPVAQVAFEKHDYYYEVFDPYEDGKPVVGSLADDFADIASDLERGMRHLEHGDVTQAVWEWSFGFQTHWGDHAIDALRALHHLCTRDSLGNWRRCTILA